MTYRFPKKLWQTLLPSEWSVDLFDRIESTNWDLLIILDACRFKVLADGAGNAAIERAVSPATATYQFLEQVYEQNVFDGAYYVSANPQTEKQSPGKNTTIIQMYKSG